MDKRNKHQELRRPVMQVSHHPSEGDKEGQEEPVQEAEDKPEETEEKPEETEEKTEEVEETTEEVTEEPGGGSAEE